jgi:hypothetical protein
MRLAVFFAQRLAVLEAFNQAPLGMAEVLGDEALVQGQLFPAVGMAAAILAMALMDRLALSAPLALDTAAGEAVLA